MRAVVQRVKSASVMVDEKLIGKINRGLLVLLGVHEDDEDKDLDYIFNKIMNLRIFDDEAGVMNESLTDQNLELLVVSQFTLIGDARKGNRPSYFKAAKFEKGNGYYEEFIKRARENNIVTETGEYGADMQVELINDGPVTILLDSYKDF